MPELPEVEIIKRGLQKYIVGQEIADIEVLSPKQFVGDPRRVIGAKITGVRRFGKALVVDFSNGFSVAIHVKMTGQLLFVQQQRTKNREQRISMGVLPNKWTRVVFNLKSQKSNLKTKSEISKIINSQVYFNDIRRFGWVRVVETKRVMDLSFFKNLGLEPMRDLDLSFFRSIIASSKAPIKSVLMDQHRISGIGNIYANEALFLARIHPMRKALSLTKVEAERLLEAIEEVLRRSIEAGGSSMTNYLNASGEKGAYQEHFLVYGQEGKRCPVCKGVIKKTKTGGRGTFYCEECQE